MSTFKVYLKNGEHVEHEAVGATICNSGALILYRYTKDSCGTYVLVAYAAGEWKALKETER